VLPDTAMNDEGELIHFAFLPDVEPLNYKEAMQIGVWKKTMIEEIKAIEKNNIWKSVELPEKKKTIDVKWILKVKLNLDDTISKHKARLVARSCEIGCCIR
jgi:hypothetical protein